MKQFSSKIIKIVSSLCTLNQNKYIGGTDGDKVHTDIYLFLICIIYGLEFVIKLINRYLIHMAFQWYLCCTGIWKLLTLFKFLHSLAVWDSPCYLVFLKRFVQQWYFIPRHFHSRCMKAKIVSTMISTPKARV